MARARARSRRPSPPAPPSTPANGPEIAPETTGKFLVLLREDAMKEGLASLKSSAGLSKVCRASDFESSALDIDEASKADVVVFEKLGVAVVDADPQQIGSLSAMADTDSEIMAVEPERIMHAISSFPDPATQFDPQPMESKPFEYLRGYKDAVNAVYAMLTGTSTEEAALGQAIAAAFADSSTFTWGLQAARVSTSRFSGRNIRVAVLDTGFDLAHPDFLGRTVVSQSFITGQTVQDGNGHGTHCIGTSLGPKQPAGRVRRYGCAYGGAIFAGKVLSNQGSGADTGILAGINWAITNRCRIVSMSLGARTQVGEPFSQIYEQAATRALNANTLIIAAAGNDSQRPGMIVPVGRPANCPSIMAVASLDADLGVSFYSCGGLNPNGGGVDIAAPGRNVFSSWPMPKRYNIISGTSMATPHVAGIAALWLEARGVNTSARGLWQALVSNARRLNLPSRDVGSGLVQAPI